MIEATTRSGIHAFYKDGSDVSAVAFQRYGSSEGHLASIRYNPSKGTWEGWGGATISPSFVNFYGTYRQAKDKILSLVALEVLRS